MGRETGSRVQLVEILPVHCNEDKKMLMTTGKAIKGKATVAGVGTVVLAGFSCRVSVL